MVHVGEEASCLSVGLSAGMVCCDRRGGKQTMRCVPANAVLFFLLVSHLLFFPCPTGS